MGNPAELEMLRRRLAEVERERAEAYDRIRLLDVLARSLAEVAASREAADVIAISLRTVQTCLGFRRAVYFERTEEGLVARAIADAADGGFRARSISDIPCPTLAAKMEDAITIGLPHDLSAPLVDVRGWYVFAPIGDGDGSYGFVCADDHPKREPLGWESDLFAILGTVAAAAIRGSMLYQRVRRLALEDPLTGLLNRRAIAERLAAAIETARRNGEGCAVAILDVDDFKSVNDRLGHLVGDAILSRVARTLANASRSGEEIGRFAGDEFIVIFRGCNAEDARRSVRRLSGALRGNGLRCSIGAALFPQSGDGPSALLAAADRALYAVKDAGKNGFAFA